MTEESQKTVLSTALVQAIGEYLVSRPYREVAGLLSTLQTEIQAAAQVNGTQQPIDIQGVQETVQ